MAKILIIEDERELAKVLQAYLERSNFEVLTAYDADDGKKLWDEQNPDLVLLDLNLPGMDGLELAKEMRRTKDTPVIMTTARVDEVDRLLGLELGSDDYVIKPYSPREVVARVKAVLRRINTKPVEEPIKNRISGLVIDPSMHLVTVKDQPVNLTPTEFDILSTLASQPGHVFTRLQLIEETQGISGEGYERSVDVHIKNLRHKLRAADPETDYIKTIFGVGYRTIKTD
ncbi:MAG TPA: response regulator transcription factor [Anaerolineaceae bacterium]|nr:response regulator transcription factor [Anaerolineaceae bacterium]